MMGNVFNWNMIYDGKCTIYNLWCEMYLIEFIIYDGKCI